MTRDLEVEGFAWGRNRSFGAGVYAARFRIDHIIRNTALPNVEGFDEVSIPGMFALPTYSPFIHYHLILALEPINSSSSSSTTTTNAAKRGARLFVVKRIISCKTRAITKKTLREFLVSLYDNTHRDDAETLTRIDDYDAQETPTAGGSRWFREIVAPLISHWPEDGLNQDNRDEALQMLRHRCSALLLQTTINATTTNAGQKRKRVDLDTSRAASVYAIIHSKVQPCARGDIFEVLLQFFHEALLLGLREEQRRLLLGYVYDTPVTFLFWPLLVSKLMTDPEFQVDSTTRITLLGHQSNFADYHDRLLNGVGLSFDPEMPAWSWLLYEQAVHIRETANNTTNATVVRMAFTTYLNLERHFYYTWTSSAIPYPATQSTYLQKMLLSSANDSGAPVDEHIRFLLDTGAVMYGAKPNLLQLTTVHSLEMRFVQQLHNNNTHVTFVDADMCCSLLFLREWKERRVLPSRVQFQDDDTVRVFTCNQAYASYAASVLGRPVLDIFNNTTATTTTTAATDDTNVRVICVWMAHKIPLPVITRMLARYTSKNNIGADGSSSSSSTPLVVYLIGDGTDFVNANFAGQPFIRFRECISLPSYVMWTISNELIRNNRGPVGDSAAAYMNMRLERQSSFDSKHGALTTLFADIKSLDTKQRKHDANETYVVLCSNQAAKKSLHQRLAGLSARFCPLTFQLKQMVYVEQSNSRALLESARSTGVNADDVASMAEIDLRRAVYELTVDGRRYNSNETRMTHSTFETVAHYVGTPVQTVIFVVTEHTTAADVRIAAKYARTRLRFHYSFDTTFATLQRREFPSYNDFANKLIGP